MTTIGQYTDCSTAGLRSLDLQLIHQINRIVPGLLVDFSKFNVVCGGGVHPYLQAPAAKALERAIKQRGKAMGVNSAYRTLPQQFVLYSHCQCRPRRCGIVAAAAPGASNHNTGLALDINDAAGWRPYLEDNGWDWIGSFDPMHFDYKGGGTKNLSFLSIKAFQQLWNYNYASTKYRVTEDGCWGKQTEKALKSVSVNGFESVPGIERSQSVPDLPPTPAPLRLGDSGEAVRELQLKLKITIDGEFGQKTLEALKKFQEENGLSADGVVGVQTFARLKA